MTKPERPEGERRKRRVIRDALTPAEQAKRLADIRAKREAELRQEAEQRQAEKPRLAPITKKRCGR